MKFYQPNSEALDAERSKDAREVADQGGQKAFYLQAGITNVRVLPPFSEKGVWYRELWEYNVVVDGQRRVFTAPQQQGLPDPFEEKKQALLAAGGDHNVKLAETFKVSRRFLFNALVWVAPPGVEFTKGEVVVLKAPVTVKRALLEMDRDVQGGWADITSPGAGVNVKISRTGKGLNTTYSVSPMPNRTNIAADLQQVQVDVNTLQLHNLDSLYQPLPYAELKAILVNVGNVQPQATQVQVPVATSGYVQVTQPPQLVPMTVTVPGVVPLTTSAATVPLPTVMEQFVPGMEIPPPPPLIK